MIKIFVDSGSSIKPHEAEALGVGIIPLHIIMNGKEYRDGEGLTTEEFYRMLIEDKIFPRTSLPSLAEAEERVRGFTQRGDHVIFLTISSGLSGTYSAISGLFADDPLVHVVDTKTAVGIEHRHRRRSKRQKPHPVVDIPHTRIKFDPAVEQHGIEKLIVRDDVIQVNALN